MNNTNIITETGREFARELGWDYDVSRGYVALFLQEKNDIELYNSRIDPEYNLKVSGGKTILHQVNKLTVLDFLEGVALAATSITANGYGVVVNGILAGIFVVRKLGQISTVKLDQRHSSVVLAIEELGTEEFDNVKLIAHSNQILKQLKLEKFQIDEPQFTDIIDTLETLGVVSANKGRWEIVDKLEFTKN